MNNYFYMVHVENGDSPTYKHDTLESAEIESKRLAKLLNRKAYVLCSIKSFEINEFDIVDCRPSKIDDLPF